ncbi:hypothetical protein NDZ80_001607 [Vibrio vulnificus]|nr:hypothetical protein [Vibrio vulnificus]
MTEYHISEDGVNYIVVNKTAFLMFHSMKDEDTSHLYENLSKLVPVYSYECEGM